MYKMVNLYIYNKLVVYYNKPHKITNSMDMQCIFAYSQDNPTKTNSFKTVDLNLL